MGVISGTSTTVGARVVRHLFRPGVRKTSLFWHVNRLNLCTQSKQEALQAGMHDFYAKPLDISAVVRRIFGDAAG